MKTARIGLSLTGLAFDFFWLWIDHLISPDWSGFCS